MIRKTLGGESSAFVKSDVLVRLRTVNSVDLVAASSDDVKSAVARLRGRVMDTVGASASDRSGVDVHEADNRGTFKRDVGVSSRLGVLRETGSLGAGVRDSSRLRDPHDERLGVDIVTSSLRKIGVSESLPVFPPCSL